MALSHTPKTNPPYPHIPCQCFQHPGRTFEPSTNRLLWAAEVEGIGRQSVFEAPDGTIYAAAGREGKHFVHMFSKEGGKKGIMEFNSRPSDIVFRKDGTILMAFDSSTVQIIAPSYLQKGNYRILSTVTDKGYIGFQASSDGRFIYGSNAVYGGTSTQNRP